ncbi:hypothetical protein JW968_03395 [Candidatus Woesearchaeota archaeon]|nr:hypothetical protein [Candidatus Woesearchaeota archaeon]
MSDIYILLIDKNKGNGSNGKGGCLDQERLELEAAGFRVGDFVMCPETLSLYDIVIANPRPESVEKLSYFHRNHPEVPLIVYGGLMKDNVEICSINKDQAGVYIPVFSRMEDFVAFIQSLAYYN